MKRITYASLLSVAVLLVGCTIPPRTPENVAENVTVKDSEYDKKVLIQGPVFYGPILFGKPTYSGYLNIFRDRNTGEITYAIAMYWKYHRGSWRFFERPTLPGAEELSTVVDRNVNCGGGSCDYVEYLASAMTAQQLASAGDTIKIRYSTKVGYEFADIQKTYIQGFLTGAMAKMQERGWDADPLKAAWPQ